MFLDIPLKLLLEIAVIGQLELFLKDICWVLLELECLWREVGESIYLTAVFTLAVFCFKGMGEFDKKNGFYMNLPID